MEYKIIELLRESEALHYSEYIDNKKEADRAMTDHLCHWLSDVKCLIESNYLESSEPFKLINQVNKRQFFIDEDSFNVEKDKVELALKKCLYEQQAVKSQSATFLEKIVYAIMNLFK